MPRGGVRYFDIFLVWVGTKMNLSRFLLSRPIAPRIARTERGRTPVKIHVERLEDRSLPSTSIPLTASSWTPLGPSPTYANQQTGTNGVVTVGTNGATTAPNNQPTAGQIIATAVSPIDPNTIYAATADGGVAKSINDGQTWAMMTDNLPTTTPVDASGTSLGTIQPAQRNLHIGAIATDPYDPTGNTVFAGEGVYTNTDVSYAGQGLLESTDGGNSWTLEEGPLLSAATANSPAQYAFAGGSIRKILFVQDPNNTANNYIFVLTNPQGVNSTGSTPSAVYRSSDGGTTWVSITANLKNALNNPNQQISPFRQYTDFSVDPTNPGVAYVSVGDPGGYNYNGVYRTGPNAGSGGALDANAANITWTVLLGGNSIQVPGNQLGPILAAPVPQNPSTVYALVENAGGNLLGLYRSRNSGTDVVQIALPANTPAIDPNFSALSMIIDPTTGTGVTRIYISGSNGVMVVDVPETNGTGVIPTASVQDLSTSSDKNSPYPVIHNLTFDQPLAPAASGAFQASSANTHVIASTDTGVYELTTPIPAPTLVNGVLTNDFSPAPTVTWAAINGAPTAATSTTPGGTGLNATEFFGGSTGVLNDNGFIGGTNLTGTQVFNDSGNTSPPPPPASLYNWPATSTVPVGGTAVYDFRATNANGNLTTAYQVNANSAANLVQKSTDLGQTWAPAVTGIVDPGATGDASSPFTPPLVEDPSIPVGQGGTQNVRLLLGTDVVNQTTDSATTWSEFAHNLPYVTGTGGTIDAIGISRFDPNVVYVAVTARIDSNGADFGPGLYRVNTDITLSPAEPYSTWHDVSPTLDNNGTPTNFVGGSGDDVAGYIMPPFTGAPTEPYTNSLSGNITSIAVDPTNSDIVYVTVDSSDTDASGNAINTVYKTTDGGATWTNITGNLPYRAYSVVIDPNRLNGQTNDDIYVGTADGVWKTTGPSTANTVWTRVGGDLGTSTGMPDVAVFQVSINTTTGVLAAATFGRGVWEFQIRPYLAGEVFIDTNGDGLLDNTEVGVPPPGVPVTVTDVTNPASPVQFASTVSGVGGTFSFVSLPNAQYQLGIVGSSNLPYDPSTTYQVTGPDTTYTVTNVPVATTTSGIDVPVFVRGTVSGIDYIDSNGDGIQESGEVGNPGVVVQLLDATTGIVYASTTTAADGSYTFTGVGVLPSSDPWTVRQIPTNGVVQTNPAGSLNFTLTSGQQITGKNIGVFTLGSISGTVFEDLNGSGVLDPGEPPLAGWTVNLTNTGTGVVTTTTTAADGTYTFSGLSFGTYQVSEVLMPGYVATDPNPPPVSTQSGTTVAGTNFGNFRPATISGTIYVDTNGDGVQEANETTPVAGATVALIDPRSGAVVASTTSAADGSYSFAGLVPLVLPGNTTPYQVEVTGPAKYGQTSANPSVTLTSGATVANQNIGLFVKTTISGTVFDDANDNGIQDPGEIRLPGVPVLLINTATGATVQTATTDANGAFTFSAVSALAANGATIPYEVEADPNGYTTTTPETTVTLTSGVPVTGLKIGVYQDVLFTGVTYNDVNGDGIQEANEPAVAGFTVQLVDTNGNVVATTTSSATGAYSLYGGPGTFTVREVPPTGWVQTTPNPGYTTTTDGGPLVSTNFGNFQTITLSGVVYDDINGNATQDAGEPPLVGWTVQLVNSSGTVVNSTTTDVNGAFSFSGVGPGTYSLQEVLQPGYAASTPSSYPVTGVSGQSQTFAFGDYVPGTVSGTIFEDLGRDGTFDSGDPGSAGWTVDLLNGNGTVVASATTGSGGTYSFGTLAPGSYSVQLVPRPSWVVTTALPPAVTLASSQSLTFANIGVLRFASLGGFVYIDANRNSIKDPSERGLAGGVVGLFDSNGNQISTITTGADGSYFFGGLDNGTYTVKLISNTAGFSLSGPNPTASFTETLTVGSTTASNDVEGLNFGLDADQRYAIAADGGGGPGSRCTTRSPAPCSRTSSCTS
ncbi:hypothetical protein FRUB_05354 [Fimbriiglobus ruber]|uniref:SD-repeat containing protein B domain-containing protein n=2 Tax=Fimbriiglobus ruber TaxID=1908690 RepID=A0A225DVV0_9BACT|nr:hypothetical protein FRUB_05354 [Fimbriiglobus ruber]